MANFVLLVIKQSIAHRLTGYWKELGFDRPRFSEHQLAMRSARLVAILHWRLNPPRDKFAPEIPGRDLAEMPARFDTADRGWAPISMFGLVAWRTRSQWQALPDRAL